jgi:hypothetical protein
MSYASNPEANVAKLTVRGNTYENKDQLKKSGFMWQPAIRGWVQTKISVSRARSIADAFGPKSKLIFELEGEGTEEIPDNWLQSQKGNSSVQPVSSTEKQNLVQSKNAQESSDTDVEQIFAQAHQRQREIEHEKNKLEKGRNSRVELTPRKKTHRKQAGISGGPNRYEQKRKARIKKAFEEGDQQRNLRNKPSSKAKASNHTSGQAVNWSVPNESPRYIDEPLGTREDFKRDSAGNRSRSSKIKD